MEREGSTGKAKINTRWLASAYSTTWYQHTMSRKNMSMRISRQLASRRIAKAPSSDPPVGVGRKMILKTKGCLDTRRCRWSSDVRWRPDYQPRSVAIRFGVLVLRNSCVTAVSLRPPLALRDMILPALPRFMIVLSRNWRWMKLNEFWFEQVPSGQLNTMIALRFSPLIKEHRFTNHEVALFGFYKSFELLLTLICQNVWWSLARSDLYY